jgi:hypothetical protein
MPRKNYQEISSSLPGCYSCGKSESGEVLYKVQDGEGTKFPNFLTAILCYDCSLEFCKKADGSYDSKVFEDFMIRELSKIGNKIEKRVAMNKLKM